MDNCVGNAFLYACEGKRVEADLSVGPGPAEASGHLPATRLDGASICRAAPASAPFKCYSASHCRVPGR